MSLLGNAAGMTGTSLYAQQSLYAHMANRSSQMGQGFAAAQDFAYDSICNCVVCDKPGVHTHEIQQEKQETNMYESFKAWRNKHSEILFTIAAILVADHFLFGGKFRSKVEAMVDGLIAKASKKIEAHDA